MVTIEQRRERRRAEYQRHREHYIRRAAEYQRANPDRVAAASRRYRARNPGKRRDTILRYRYKLSLAEYERMREQQEGRCKSCGTLAARLYVDHDHGCCPRMPTCGQCTRGLVCNGCNTMDRLSDPWTDKRGCLRGRIMRAN